MPAQDIGLAEAVFQPGCTEVFLNAQLLECMAIVCDAGWLYRNSIIPPDERTYFVNQMINLMDASAKISAAIARLKGIEEPVPTTRQIFEVKHALPPRGEGLGLLWKTNKAMETLAEIPAARRKRGTQPGNCNAFRNGLHSGRARAFTLRVRAWKRRTKMLLELAEMEIAFSSPACGGGTERSEAEG